MCDLVIYKMSDCAASVAGGKDIILLCDKVTKGEKDTELKRYIELEIIDDLHIIRSTGVSRLLFKPYEWMDVRGQKPETIIGKLGLMRKPDQQ